MIYNIIQNKGEKIAMLINKYFINKINNKLIYYLLILILLLFTSCTINKNYLLKITNVKAEILAPLPNSKNLEIEVDITFENTSKKTVEFDLIKAVFFQNDKAVSASTYITELRYGVKGISGYYSDNENNISPPEIKPELQTVIKSEEKTTFEFYTANSNYGKLDSNLKKELILNFYKNDNKIYGPYKIIIKNNKSPASLVNPEGGGNIIRS